MAYTNFLKPNSVTQTTGATEITWNLDSSPYNINTGSGCQLSLTSYEPKSTGLLIYSGWNTTVVPPNNNEDATFVDAYSVGNREVHPQGLAFNNDGTKMFVTGLGGEDVNGSIVEQPVYSL